MITVNEAIKQRHSVRSYTDRAIPADIAAELRKLIADCNREGGFIFESKIAGTFLQLFEKVAAKFPQFL